jgi:hypothetical protein
MKTPAPSHLALVTAASISACGEPVAPVVPEPDLPTRPDVGAPTDVGLDLADASDIVEGRSARGCLLTPPDDLTGWWALDETQTALVSNVPAIGTMTQTSRSLYLVEISQNTADPERPLMRARLCDWVTADDIGLTTTAMNPSIFALMASMTRELTLTDDPAEPRLTTSEGIQLRGLRLDAPAVDAFPTALDDPRVFDEDGDANPGVTLFLNGLFPGTLHVAHRHKARLDGCFLEADHVAGLTTWTTEQLILGSEPATLMDVQPDAQTHPDASLSFFSLRRATVDSALITDCEALKSARDALFPPVTEPDAE